MSRINSRDDGYGTARAPRARRSADADAAAELAQQISNLLATRPCLGEFGEFTAEMGRVEDGYGAEAAAMGLAATLVERVLTMQGALGASFVKNTLAVSHRWEEPGNPDATGVQLKAIREHLHHHQHIEHVWFGALAALDARSSGPWPSLVLI